MGSIELRCEQAAHSIDYHVAVYLVVAISKYCFAGIFLSICLRDITFMFLKTSECGLSHDVLFVTLTYLFLCERQAFLWRILFQIPLKKFYITKFAGMYSLLCKRHVFHNSILIHRINSFTYKSCRCHIKCLFAFGNFSFE